MTRDRPNEALAALGRVSVGARDSLGRDFANEAVRAYHRLGEFQRGLDLIRAIGPNREEDPSWYRLELRQLAALGRMEELVRMVDERARLTSANTIWNFGQDLNTSAEELRAHGHAREAKAVFERAVAWFRDRPAPLTPAGAEMLTGFASALYGAERWDEAREAFRKAALVAMDSSGPNTAWVGLGASAARLGDRAEATRVDRWLEKNGARVGRGSLFSRARIAALLGDRERAVAMLQQLTARGGGFGGLHVYADFAFLSGYGPFEDLLLVKG